ncbi:hypothetical protein SKAU_G00056970 [Synaphobranchus kaupii]|uniref:B30.2/SPRY domain-containing protein n=1 Tax=Synaphobranchus kaupii TaxID=118154 RepID=A0A9Q1G565_SYNKA|nr:hypothetical protein SKAU_G00056970 [Synaphobranchus kaupii]
MKQTSIKAEVSKAKTGLEGMFDLAKESVAEQHRELRELIDQNMQQAFLLIQAMKESMLQDMEQLVRVGEEYQEKSKHIQDIVEQLKRSQNTDYATMISDIAAVETRIEDIEDYQRNFLELITVDNSRLKALENSINKIIQINKDLLPRPWEFGENITFDDSIPLPHLKISGDKTKMQYRVSADSNKSHKRKQRETTVNVLASQSFTEGSHYWEVNAKNIERWTVGVVEQGWVKKGVQQALGQDRLSWALQMDGDSLVALHNDDTIMIREAVIERLGIFLDFKKGRLQFFNVNSGSVLHTFVGKFKNALFPVFSIESQNGTKAVMSLCTLMPKEMDTIFCGNERRMSSDSGIERAPNSSIAVFEENVSEPSEDSEPTTSTNNDPTPASDQSSNNDSAML